MRLALIGLLAAMALASTACSANGPGSPEWCKNTPQEQQVKEPAAMAKCLEVK